MQVDNITVGIDIGFENIVSSMMKEFTMPVLHGAPIESDIGTEWYTVEDLQPISSHIGHQCIWMEANIQTDWKLMLCYHQRQHISLRLTLSPLTQYIHL